MGRLFIIAFLGMIFVSWPIAIALRPFVDQFIARLDKPSQIGHNGSNVNNSGIHYVTYRHCFDDDGRRRPC